MGKDSTMGVLEAIRARRAVRHYQADAVDEATVQAATGMMAVHGRRDGSPRGGGNRRRVIHGRG